MKKIAKVLCMVVIVALAFTSCKKKENTTKFFGHVSDLVTEDGERAYLQGTTVFFEEGDNIVVMKVDENNYTNSRYSIFHAATTGTNVEFVGEVGLVTAEPTATGDQTFMAVYPGDYCQMSNLNTNDYFNTTDNGSMYVALRNTMDYRLVNGLPGVPAKALCMAARDNTTVGDNVNNVHFNFKNIMGVLNLKLKDTSATPKKVTSIVYEDAVLNVTGYVHAKPHEVFYDEFMGYFDAYTDLTTPPAGLAAALTRIGYYVDGPEKGKVITLNCVTPDVNGVQLGATPTSFYMPLRPLAMIGGSSIRVNFEDGSYIVINDRFSKVKPNVIKNVTRDVNDYPMH